MPRKCGLGGCRCISEELYLGHTYWSQNGGCERRFGRGLPQPRRFTVFAVLSWIVKQRLCYLNSGNRNLWDVGFHGGSAVHSNLTEEGGDQENCMRLCRTALDGHGGAVLFVRSFSASCPAVGFRPRHPSALRSDVTSVCFCEWILKLIWWKRRKEKLLEAQI